MNFGRGNNRAWLPMGNNQAVPLTLIAREARRPPASRTLRLARNPNVLFRVHAAAAERQAPQGMQQDTMANLQAILGEAMDLIPERMVGEADEEEMLLKSSGSENETIPASSLEVCGGGGETAEFDGTAPEANL
ncbi:expressed unknown protein [Seminavis robusta]|uniref:Uncharacterized protein n=1 Tax=Seminavis robusta TaxID=568900 RepID=A0A9N8EBD9_9STRA|nr:expressed unknown protein [Seminavis robusta]|eukprot:Sro921_g220410.1 n/a (134) ;mRNA; r:30142-30543